MSVIIASATLVVAGAVLAWAWLAFDGTGLVAGLLDRQSLSQVVPPAAAKPSQPEPVALSLPTGMPEAFALRLWQEQVESQRMIARLVEGEISSLEVTGVTTEGDHATVKVEVAETGGTRLPGTLGLRRFAERWYVADVSAGSEAQQKSDDSPLPEVADLDIAALNTILTQHEAHSDLLDSLASGEVKRIIVKDATPGPNTATIALDIVSDGATRGGDLVVVRSESGQGAVWVIARLVESEPSAKQ